MQNNYRQSNNGKDEHQFALKVQIIFHLWKNAEGKPYFYFCRFRLKGLLFAPLCSEVLVAQILGEACPVPKSLLQKLDAQRFQKKVKPKKPYFKSQ